MAKDQRSFADKLKALREAVGLSQRALGKMCGITGSAISLLESGQTLPTWITVQTLARALNVECEDLRDAVLPEVPEIEPQKSPGRPRKAEEPAVEEPKKKPRKKKE